MKDRLRGFLGFLGLVEDEYGDYGPSNAPRPFSEGEPDEPEWTPNQPPPRPAYQSRAPMRPAAPTPPPTLAARSSSPISVLDGGASRVRPMTSPNSARGTSSIVSLRDVAVVAPGTYDDSKRITDHLRAGRPVVLTTLRVDQALARRLVDFTAGTCYALGAKIDPLLRGVYLVSPSGTIVSTEVKEQLRATDFSMVE